MTLLLDQLISTEEIDIAGSLPWPSATLWLSVGPLHLHAGQATGDRKLTPQRATMSNFFYSY